MSLAILAMQTSSIELFGQTHTFAECHAPVMPAEQMKPPASLTSPPQPSSVTFLFCSRDVALLLFLRFSFSSSIAFTSTSPRFFFNWEAAWAMIGCKKWNWRSTTHYTRVSHLKSQRSSGAGIDKTGISEEKIGVEKERGGKGRKMPSLKRRMEKSRCFKISKYKYPVRPLFRLLLCSFFLSLDCSHFVLEWWKRRGRSFFSSPLPPLLPLMSSSGSVRGACPG